MAETKVEIEWLDTYEESAGWHSIQDAIKMKPKTVLSIGYVLLETKEYIILAADIDPKLKKVLDEKNTIEKILEKIKTLLKDKDALDGCDCGRLQVIPKHWVKKTKLL
jgi:hypothetical protein